MKVNEVKQMSDAKLFETIDRDNTTGFLTEDLVKIYRTHTSESWDEASFDDELARLELLDEEDNAE